MYPPLTTLNNNEKILVLLDLESYSPYTVLRGADIASLFKASLSILFLVTNEALENNSSELDLALAEVEKLTTPYGVDQFETKVYNKGSHLKDLLNGSNYTQIVLSHFGENRFEEIFHGTFTNRLLKNFPEIELHFVSTKNAFPYDSWEYEKEKNMHVVKRGEKLSLAFHDENSLGKGVYFKDNFTDFENGIFIYTSDNSFRTMTVKNGILEGEVTWLDPQDKGQ